MSESEEKRLIEQFQEMIDESHRPKPGFAAGVLRMWPIITALVLITSHLAISVYVIHDHVSKPAHSGAAAKLGLLETAVAPMIADSADLKKHLRERSLHQSDAEKTARIIKALEPIKESLSGLKSNMDKMSRDMEDMKKINDKAREDAAYWRAMSEKRTN